LREFRQSKQLSAEEVAARIELFNENYELKVSANHLHKIERQEKPLTDLLFFAYSEAIGVSSLDVMSVYVGGNESERS
jgi:transcriptional regulator with XRE-family HTH domain